MTVQSYYAKWMRNCQEIEVLKARKFNLQEKMDAFADGLNHTIQKGLPFWKVESDTFREFVSSIIDLEAEMMKRSAYRVKRKPRSKAKGSRREKSKRKSLAACWEYQKHGRCRFGNSCKYEHERRKTKGKAEHQK